MTSQYNQHQFRGGRDRAFWVESDGWRDRDGKKDRDFKRDRYAQRNREDGTASECGTGGRDRDDKAVNRMITKAGCSGNVTALMDVIGNYGEKMNLINISTALHRLAKIVSDYPCQNTMKLLKGQSSFQKLQTTLWNHIMELSRLPQKVDASSDMRCLSIVCWSYASLTIGDKRLFDIISDLCLSRWHELKPFEASNVLWAFSKLNFLDATFLNGAVPRLLKMDLAECSPQVLSTICWAFGRATYHPHDLFKRLTELLYQCTEKLAPQGIANTLWAFARLQRQDAALFRCLGEAAIRGNILAFKPQELSNIAWAFASMRQYFPLLFDGIAQAALEQESHLQPQNISNLVWAFGKVQPKDPSTERLFHRLLVLAAQRIKLYKPKELSSLVWGVSRIPDLQRWQGTTLQVLLKEVRSRLDLFPPQSLACTAEALTSTGLRQPELFDLIIRKSLSRLCSFEAPSLCTLLRTLSEEAARRLECRALQDHLWHLSEHIAATWDSFMPHHIDHFAATLTSMSPKLHPCCESMFYFCHIGDAGREAEFGQRVGKGTRAAWDMVDKEAQQYPMIERISCDLVQPADVGSHPESQEGAKDKDNEQTGTDEEQVAARKNGLVETLHQTFQVRQRQHVSPVAQGFASNGSCGLAALAGNSLIVKGTFLEFQVPTTTATRVRARSAPPTTGETPPTRAREERARQGGFVNAVWARLRREVPTLPRCEKVMLKANQPHLCSVDTLRVAGGLVGASWMDTEVAGAVAVMLQQLWHQHHHEMAQCPTCLKCFEAHPDQIQEADEHSMRSSASETSQDEHRVPKLLCFGCHSSSGSTACGDFEDQSHDRDQDKASEAKDYDLQLSGVNESACWEGDWVEYLASP